MEPGSDPNSTSFNPNQFKPTSAKVKRSHWAVILVILVLLVVGGGWLIVQKTKKALSWYDEKKQKVLEGNYGDKRFDTVYAQPFDPAVKIAKLTLNGGTCIYTLRDTTNQLIHADAVLFTSRYGLSGNKDGSSYEMELSMKSRSKTHIGSHSDSISLKLNPTLAWDLSVNTGAAELNFDLTKFKVHNFKIAGSAGAFTVKVGQPMEETNISFATGAADITLNVPKDAACRIEQHSAFSSTKFDGFTKKDDGSYQTDGYASAKSRILIRFTGGISDFKVNRY